MNEDAVVVLILSAALAVAMGMTAVAGRRETLPRGSFLGIRTNATRQTDETWKVAHVAAAPYNLAAAAIFGMTGLVSAFATDTQQAASTVVVIGWGAAMIATGAAVFFARRAAVAELSKH